jgi:2-amino-4-hydroxy-6-hydroxymethyldihydropteridine diphosphokinase
MPKEKNVQICRLKLITLLVNTAYILLGGNIGNVLQTFDNARTLINGVAGHVTASSSIYRSLPWGFQSHYLFLNQALEISTILQPFDLLATLFDIEKSLGRKRIKKGYQSRLIDIDILFYENIIIDQGGLTLPHPRMHLRKFTLLPLAEIAPNYIHPLMNNTVRELLQLCQDESEVEKV